MTQEPKKLSKKYTNVEVKYLEKVGHPVSPVRDRENKDKVYLNSQRVMCGLDTFTNEDGHTMSFKFLGEQVSQKDGGAMFNGKLFYDRANEEWGWAQMPSEIAMKLIGGFENIMRDTLKAS